MLQRIGQIMVTAHDLERAVRFYRETLGMRFLFQVPKMAFFDCSGVRVMLGVPDKPEFDHPASIVYYRVDDIEGEHAALTGRGVTFETPTHVVARLEAFTLWIAFFRDTEGNLLALMSEMPRS